ncbi:hypothetical protein AB6A40_003922 [Gnathostoma spinigerum]|uniref:Uncharacterized protein n=1 Tax=Gnathostoma spinigerum TaxID=75299 RepID=A0ABD6EAY8_9BILA
MTNLRSTTPETVGISESDERFTPVISADRGTSENSLSDEEPIFANQANDANSSNGSLDSDDRFGDDMLGGRQKLIIEALINDVNRTETESDVRTVSRTTEAPFDQNQRTTIEILDVTELFESTASPSTRTTAESTRWSESTTGSTKTSTIVKSSELSTVTETPDAESKPPNVSTTILSNAAETDRNADAQQSSELLDDEQQSTTSTLRPVPPAVQPVKVSPASDVGPPAYIPPSDFVVHRLNTVEDFMKVAMEMQLRKRVKGQRRRKREAEIRVFLGKIS